MSIEVVVRVEAGETLLAALRAIAGTLSRAPAATATPPAATAPRPAATSPAPSVAPEARPAAPQPAPKPLRAPTPPPKEKPEEEALLTDARRELLRREWPLGTPIGTVTTQFNALPGRKLDNARIAQLASQMGVRRPAGHPTGRRRSADDDAIARHIAEHGVKLCPPAAVGETTAQIPDAARAAVRVHDDKAEAHHRALNGARSNPRLKAARKQALAEPYRPELPVVRRGQGAAP